MPFSPANIPVLNISYKPQKISPKSQGTVQQLLHEKIRDAYVHPQFVTDVIRPMKIEDIMDQVSQAFSLFLMSQGTANLNISWLNFPEPISFFQEVQNLSGGELQRVAMTLCLGKPADVYLIDEPSAYLDSEQRLVAAKVSWKLLSSNKFRNQQTSLYNEFF